jgi:hypothetical protein
MKKIEEAVQAELQPQVSKIKMDSRRKYNTCKTKISRLQNFVIMNKNSSMQLELTGLWKRFPMLSE